jgi:hypothetical protein
MRYYAGPSTIGPQAQHMGIRAVMDAPKGGSQIGAAFYYETLSNPGPYYVIILTGTVRPGSVPGRFRLTDGAFVLIPGTEGEGATGD